MNKQLLLLSFLLPLHFFSFAQEKKANFLIQIGAYKSKQKENKHNQFDHLLIIPASKDEYIRYFTGDVYSKEEGIIEIEKIKANGIHQAFLVNANEYLKQKKSVANFSNDISLIPINIILVKKEVPSLNEAPILHPFPKLYGCLNYQNSFTPKLFIGSEFVYNRNTITEHLIDKKLDSKKGTISGGITFYYKFAKKLAIESGLFYHSEGKTDQQYLATDVTLYNRYLEIPFRLNYDLLTRHNFTLFLSGGPNLLINSPFGKKGSITSIEKTAIQTITPSFLSPQLAIEILVGFAYPISDNIILSFRTGFNQRISDAIQFKGDSPYNKTLQSTRFHLGISYQL